MEKICMGQSV